MCNRVDCANNIGKWVQFGTQWGTHRGIITDVNQRAVLVRVPRQYAPVGLASLDKTVDKDDEKRLDLALAYGGYGGGYGGRPGYGYGRYGAGWGRPGYGGWYGGWWWWWLAFAWIFWLWWLW